MALPALHNADYIGTLVPRSHAKLALAGRFARCGTRWGSAFHQLVTVGRSQSEPVDLFETSDLFQGFTGEGLFALEGVEANAFEQVAKPQVGVLGEAFQHLQQ
jgi:hypothetical protein